VPPAAAEGFDRVDTVRPAALGADRT
jgi:hypothetical protein